eukprot:3092574-Amphidinium_carterae.1
MGYSERDNAGHVRLAIAHQIAVTSIVTVGIKGTADVMAQARNVSALSAVPLSTCWCHSSMAHCR